MTQLSVKKQVEQSFNDSNSSSYLSQCSDDDNDDYDMALALKQKCTQLQENLVMKKSITQDLSTSEFSFQTEANPHSQQEAKKLNQSNQSNAKSANSDPSNDNIKLKNKANLHQDTLDLNQMLKILDQCQKDEQKTKIQNPNHQNFRKFNQSPQKFPKFQPYPKEISKRVNQKEYFYDNKTKVSFYREQQKLFERRQPRLPYKFINYHQKFYPSQNSSTKSPYHTQKNSRKIFTKRAEQFASQNYLFWGVLISVKLASFMSISKNVLVVPFSNTQFSDPVSKIIQSKIKYNLKEIVIKESIKCKEKQVPNGNVFSVKAKGLQSNYRGLYFIKSPQNSKQGLKYYDVNLLKKGIEKIFNLLDSHNEGNLVFPEFHWGSFSQGEICEVLISGIFREINEKKKSHQCPYLKEVIICVSNCETFELYSKCLRFYVKQMIG